MSAMHYEPLKYLKTRFEVQLLLVTFEQDVAEMRNLLHHVCSDKSFPTSYRMISMLKYQKRALMKNKMYACSESTSTVH